MTLFNPISAFAGMTFIELLAVGCALLYLLLAIKKKVICWVFGGISAFFYLILMLNMHLYMLACLQGFYVLMAFYGFIQWKKENHTSDNLRGTGMLIITWPFKHHIIALLVLLTLTGLHHWLFHTPYLEAFIAFGSALTTWMVARRLLENWIYWFFIDILSAYLYYTQNLIATTVLFILYTLLAVYGYFDWKDKRAFTLTRPSGTLSRQRRGA